MSLSQILVLCLALKLTVLNAVPVQEITEKATITNNSKEWDENIEILNEIQKKVNLLSERMHEYKHKYANMPEGESATDDIIVPDCSSGCDDAKIDNDNSNMSNNTFVAVNFDDFAQSSNEENSNPSFDIGESDDSGDIINRHDDANPEQDEILHFPVQMPPETYFNPKDDIEVFDPKESVWPVDSFHDNDADEHWIIATSDIDHDKGLLDTNIFTSHDLDYPEVKIYKNSLGLIDEEEMRKQEERHRKRFEELVRALFE